MSQDGEGPADATEAVVARLTTVVAAIAYDLYGPTELLEAGEREAGRENILRAVDELTDALGLGPPE